jgi:hypothetical protein
MKEKQRPIWKRLLTTVFGLIIFFCAVLSIFVCSLMGPYIVYHIVAEGEALSLRPPLYPNSVEIVSGENSYAGSCCLAKMWVYCTEAAADELIAYFEPYMGEFQNMNNVYYHAAVTSDNQFMVFLSSSSGFEGNTPTLELLVFPDDERCMTSSAYTYRIIYEAG